MLHADALGLVVRVKVDLESTEYASGPLIDMDGRSSSSTFTVAVAELQDDKKLHISTVKLYENPLCNILFGMARGGLSL